LRKIKNLSQPVGSAYRVKAKRLILLFTLLFKQLGFSHTNAMNFGNLVGDINKKNASK